MFPISDNHPTLRTPLMTYAILAGMVGSWFYLQGFGLDERALASSVRNLGMVPGELTRMAPIGTAVPLGRGMACVVDDDPINLITPFTSMFLHGGWLHLLGNIMFFWVFGNNVEDGMGRMRFLVFYLICGLGWRGRPHPGAAGIAVADDWRFRSDIGRAWCVSDSLSEDSYQHAFRFYRVLEGDRDPGVAGVDDVVRVAGHLRLA